MRGAACPGVDGINARQLKFFWPLLGRLFFHALCEMLREGKLSQTLRQGIVTLVIKPGKSGLDCNSFCPITLLSVFLKLFSLTLAARMQKAIKDFINSGQKAYIKGRYIGEILMNISCHCHGNRGDSDSS